MWDPRRNDLDLARIDADPEQENLAQISRWSLNTPAWNSPLQLPTIPGSANQGGEASEIPSDIGSRVRSALAEQRPHLGNQDRPSIST